jgi:hypothetical protein
MHSHSGEHPGQCSTNLYQACGLALRQAAMFGNNMPAATTSAARHQHSTGSQCFSCRYSPEPLKTQAAVVAATGVQHCPVTWPRVLQLFMFASSVLATSTLGHACSQCSCTTSEQ